MTSKMYEGMREKELKRAEELLYLDWVVNRVNFKKQINFDEYRKQLKRPTKKVSSDDNDDMIRRIEAVKARDQARASDGTI